MRVKERLDISRQNALATAEAHNEEVRALSPRIREIDKELTSTGLQLFRLAVSGQGIGDLRQRNQALLKERKKLLVSLGFSAEYTEPQYACPDCEDTGFGKDTRMCHCFRQALIKENIRSSGIGDLIDRQTFENFNLDFYRQDGDQVYARMKSNVIMAQDFARLFEEKSGTNLLMYGPTGTGKTHLSTAIAGAVIQKGYTVIYDSIQNIISTFEDEKFHSDYRNGEEKRSDAFFDCDLLILDDLGTEFSSNFSAACLYNLINTRFNNQKSMIISTNLSLEKIRDKYEDRIYSRLFSNKFLLMEYKGHDYRLYE